MFNNSDGFVPRFIINLAEQIQNYSHGSPVKLLQTFCFDQRLSRIVNWSKETKIGIVLVNVENI